MANWSLPTTASTYVNYTTELDARLDDLALGLDPALVTVTNPPTNAVRWNSATSKWEKYNGTAWANLASTYAINAATASAWATGRTVALTGDVTATSTAWTGSANLSIATTLPTVNANVGTFGATTAVPVLTVNGKGLITAVSTAALGTIATQAASAVALTGGTISGVTLTLKQSTTAAPTAEGVIEWDTDSDVLKIGTGTGTKTIADTNSAQTLTSKTLSTGSVWNGSAVPVAYGGTGATDAATARTNLGVASMGAQNASAVAITGGAISGTAITLVQSTTAAPTAEGRIEWDTDNDLLILGTAAGSKIQVNTNSVQTLTNKTFGDVVYLAAGGFMFNDDGAKDTGISWSSDGVMNVQCNASTVGQFTPAGWTGNAASATQASYVSGTNLGKTGSQGFFSTAGWTPADWSNLAIGGGGMAIAGTPGAPHDGYGFFIKLGNRDAGGGWGGIWIDYNNGDMYFGNTTVSSSYAGWNKLLSTANFNNYAPTKTGTGASGTWGISISGNAATASNLAVSRTTWENYGTISAVVGQLVWNNYGNGHTIFDASKGVSPNGTAVNNANPTHGWGGTYPTLMGWNGAETYGVRVDSARVADTVSNGVYTTGDQTIGGNKTFSNLTTFQNYIRVASATNQAYLYMGDADEGERSIHNNSNRIGFLTQAGGWGAYCDDNGNWTAEGSLTAVSDERLKTNWRDVPSDLVASLSEVKMGVYDRIDSGVTQVGVSAQSLQKVLPWAVNEDESGYLSVAYGNAALAGVIMLAREVMSLRRELNELKGI